MNDKRLYIYSCMMLLNKNSSNKVILTLNENVTLSSPFYFLFEIINTDTFEALFFTAEDVSSNSCRYNEFVITLTNGVTDNTIGLIDLEQNGFYKYNIYQQSSQFNLDKDLTEGLLETGIVYVEGEVKPVKTSYNDNENNNFIAYE